METDQSIGSLFIRGTEQSIFTSNFKLIICVGCRGPDFWILAIGFLNFYLWLCKWFKGLSRFHNNSSSEMLFVQSLNEKQEMTILGFEELFWSE